MKGCHLMSVCSSVQAFPYSTQEAHVFDEEKWPYKVHNIQVLQLAQKLFLDFVSFSQVKWSLDYQVHHQNLTISITFRNPLEI